MQTNYSDLTREEMSAEMVRLNSLVNQTATARRELPKAGANYDVELKALTERYFALMDDVDELNRLIVVSDTCYEIDNA